MGPLKLLLTTVCVVRAVLSGVEGQPPTDCVMDDFVVQTDFKVEKFLGTWYEMKWIPPDYIQPEDFYHDFLFNYTTFNNTAIAIDWYAREKKESSKCMRGRESLEKTLDEAKFIYHHMRGNPEPFWVIRTDYDNYALTYGCRNVSTSGECVTPDGGMWSRRPTLSATYRREMAALLPSLCLELDQFFEIKHATDCVPSDLGSSSARTEVSIFGVVLAILTTNILRPMAGVYLF